MLSCYFNIKFMPKFLYQVIFSVFCSLSNGRHLFIVHLHCLSNVNIPQDTETIKGLNVLAKLWLMQCLSVRHNTIKLYIERVVNWAPRVPMDGNSLTQYVEYWPTVV